MSLDTLNLLLGIGGFVLGVIGTYSQLKAFAIRAHSSSKAWLLAWAQRYRDDTAMFAKHPSAFMAYCMRRLAMAFGALFLIPYFTALLKTAPLAPHPILISTMSLVLPSYCGILFGQIISRSDEVRDYLASTQNRADD